MSKSKPVDELTLEDFEESPIWEWVTTGVKCEVKIGNK